MVLLRWNEKYEYLAVFLSLRLAFSSGGVGRMQGFQAVSGTDLRCSCAKMLSCIFWIVLRRTKGLQVFLTCI